VGYPTPQEWPTEVPETPLRLSIKTAIAKQKGQRQRLLLCDFDIIPPRGGHPYHNRYAASLGIGEILLTLAPAMIPPPGVPRSISYDALQTFAGGLVLIEAKTGHREFPWHNEKADRARREQFYSQQIIANMCGFSYLVAVDNPVGAKSIATHIPGHVIEYVPFGGH
jgi:hypothetical protein